jgi:hypothetical protein
MMKEKNSAMYVTSKVKKERKRMRNIYKKERKKERNEKEKKKKNIYVRKVNSPVL